MYSKRPHIVIGFHGCDIDVRNKLVNNPEEFQKSEKSQLKPTYMRIKSSLTVVGIETNDINDGTGTETFLRRKLDCAVIEGIHSVHKKSFDTTRGVFWEGDFPYKTAGFREKNHIQICVRNPNCIKGYFIPRDEDLDWLMP